MKKNLEKRLSDKIDYIVKSSKKPMRDLLDLGKGSLIENVFVDEQSGKNILKKIASLPPSTLSQDKVRAVLQRWCNGGGKIGCKSFSEYRTDTISPLPPQAYLYSNGTAKSYADSILLEMSKNLNIHDAKDSSHPVFNIMSAIDFDSRQSELTIKAFNDRSVNIAFYKASLPCYFDMVARWFHIATKLPSKDVGDFMVDVMESYLRPPKGVRGLEDKDQKVSDRIAHFLLHNDNTASNPALKHFYNYSEDSEKTKEVIVSKIVDIIIDQYKPSSVMPSSVNFMTSCAKIFTRDREVILNSSSRRLAEFFVAVISDKSAKSIKYFSTESVISALLDNASEPTILKSIFEKESDLKVKFINGLFGYLDNKKDLKLIDFMAPLLDEEIIIEKCKVSPTLKTKKNSSVIWSKYRLTNAASSVVNKKQEVLNINNNDKKRII